MGEKFEVELNNGEKKEATLITRIKSEGSTNEYVNDNVDDNDNDVSIYASKIVIENGKNMMKNLENEEERQEAYKIFSETYKSLRKKDS